MFFLKNTQWSRDFLTAVYARTDCINTYLPEQNAMASELQKPEVIGSTKIVPQRLFNSYPQETHWPTLMTCYQPGDFLLHFASVSTTNAPILVPLFEKYSSQIVHDRKLITLDHFLGIYGYTLEQASFRPEIDSLIEEYQRKAQEMFIH